MKTLKYLFILAAIVGFSGCDIDYFDTPNSPSDPPTSSLINNNMYEMVYDFYDEWFGGRFTQVTMQYWTQSEYGDEDRYSYRESQRETWQEFYWNLENLRKVIQYNTDEETKNAAAAYGANENQIATIRIAMAWAFNVMADTWGDIPYYSYGSDDADFEALKLADVDEEVLSPKYAPQSKIYADILNELEEAIAMMDETKSGFTEGDNVYGGDMTKWKKFANSLRLRIALKIMDADATLANSHISAISEDDVFAGNVDNATFAFESKDGTSAPYYWAYNVNNRSDFAISHSFVTLLQGENIVDTIGTDITANPFVGLVDPRLMIYAQPNDGVYAGMPVVESSAEAATIKWESLPGNAVINVPNYAQALMEYAEVMFIMSELNGWDQTYYEAGVRASMEKWGVPSADIDTYIAGLPAANEENVLTQKYIALYMDPHTAWAEYRRTGYPQTLIMPYDNFQILVPGTTDDYRKFVFEPLFETNDLPTRMKYPQFEQTLNGDNRKEAVTRLGSDAITTKLWWDVN